jgi:hypothetical protein
MKDTVDLTSETKPQEAASMSENTAHAAAFLSEVTKRTSALKNTDVTEHYADASTPTGATNQNEAQGGARDENESGDDEQIEQAPFRQPAKTAAVGTAPTATDWVPYTPEQVDCDRFSVIPGPNNTLQEVWISRERDMTGYCREPRINLVPIDRRKPPEW